MRHSAMASRVAASAALLIAAGTLSGCGKARENADEGGGTGSGCATCHGALSGAHAGHTTASAGAFGDTGVTADFLGPDTTSYAFACGNCHSLDLADHGGAVGVDLSPAGAPPGSPKARNDPGAAYTCDPGTGACTCSGVYCHSSGQATPAYVTTPDWNDSLATVGCGGCHGNPPRHATGGAGAGNANSHLGLIDEGGMTYETGHFAGFPAMVHINSDLGTPGSHGSPITCQSCHYSTTDAANTGPSGFYYLDTTGDYDLGGTGTFCFGGTGAACTGGTPSAAFACAQCHDGTNANAPAGSGKVRPYFHVNGLRDVAFDPRTAGPGVPVRPYGYGSLGAYAPTSYWAIGTDAVVDATNDYLTFSLQSASWTESTKTCSNVACHFNGARREVRWGEPLDNSGMPSGTCGVCHDK